MLGGSLTPARAPDGANSVVSDSPGSGIEGLDRIASQRLTRLIIGDQSEDGPTETVVVTQEQRVRRSLPTPGSTREYPGRTTGELAPSRVQRDGPV